MATNKNITMKQFNGVDYDILYPKTIASQIDDVYSKSETSNLFLPKAGGSMGGILDMNGNRITNLPTPTSNSEPATKEYVDGAVDFVDYTMTYTGNGKYGEANPTVFNFSKAPKWFIVEGDCIAVFKAGAKSASLAVYASTSATVRKLYPAWSNSNKKVAFYAEDGAKYQLNIEGSIYNFLIFY